MYDIGLVTSLSWVLTLGGCLLWHPKHIHYALWDWNLVENALWDNMRWKMNYSSLGCVWISFRHHQFRAEYVNMLASLLRVNMTHVYLSLRGQSPYLQPSKIAHIPQQQTPANLGTQSAVPMSIVIYCPRSCPEYRHQIQMTKLGRSVCERDALTLNL